MSEASAILPIANAIATLPIAHAIIPQITLASYSASASAVPLHHDHPNSALALCDHVTAYVWGALISLVVQFTRVETSLVLERSD